MKCHCTVKYHILVRKVKDKDRIIYNHVCRGRWCYEKGASFEWGLDGSCWCTPKRQIIKNATSDDMAEWAGYFGKHWLSVLLIDRWIWYEVSCIYSYAGESRGLHVSKIVVAI